MGTVTVTGGAQSAVLLPSFSPNTAEILATPNEIRTRDDGADSYLVPARWVCPKHVSETTATECRRWLDRYAATDAVAQPGRIRFWLQKLFAGCAGAPAEVDVRIKLDALTSAVDDQPAYCFDDATLKIAQRRFKRFIPSAGELMEFCDFITKDAREKAARAFAIIDASRRKDAPADDGARAPFAWTREASEAHGRRLRERQDAERRELLEIVRKRDADAGKVAPVSTSAPSQDAGESDLAYLARLRTWRGHGKRGSAGGLVPVGGKS